MVASRVHERILELQAAVEHQAKAISRRDFNVWRGCRITIDQFFRGEANSPTIEEFELILSAVSLQTEQPPRESTRSTS
jgi:hypothetical protein